MNHHSNHALMIMMIRSDKVHSIFFSFAAYYRHYICSSELNSEKRYYIILCYISVNIPRTKLFLFPLFSKHLDNQ